MMPGTIITIAICMTLAATIIAFWRSTVLVSMIVLAVSCLISGLMIGISYLDGPRSGPVIEAEANPIRDEHERQAAEQAAIRRLEIARSELETVAALQAAERERLSQVGAQLAKVEQAIRNDTALPVDDRSLSGDQLLRYRSELSATSAAAQTRLDELTRRQTSLEQTIVDNLGRSTEEP